MSNTIAENLQRLVSAKSDIINAITNKGVSISSNAGYEAFPAAITNINTSGNDLNSVLENNITDIYDENVHIFRHVPRGGDDFENSIKVINFPNCTECDIDPGDFVEVYLPNCSVIPTLVNYNYWAGTDIKRLNIGKFSSFISPDTYTIPSNITNLLLFMFSTYAGPIIQNQIEELHVGLSYLSSSFFYSYNSYSCSQLQVAGFPLCTGVGESAFASCSTLQSVSLPICSEIGTGAFIRCSSLIEISLPNCKTVGTNAFQSCTSLSILSFPKCETINAGAFSRCTNLSKLYLMNSTICTLANTTAFTYTPMSNSTYLGYFGSIYVPSSLLASYKTKTNWVRYSNRIVGV